MQDRFVRGFIAGIIGMLIATIPDISAFALRISVSRYLDVAGVLLWGDVPKATWETIFAWFATVGFCGLLGIVFVYLIPFIGSKYYMFKGIVFGIASWFLIYAVGSLYKVPLLVRSTPETSVVHLFACMIYGAVIGYFLAWADRRIVTGAMNRDNSMNFSMPSPAYKLYNEPSQEKDNNSRDK